MFTVTNRLASFVTLSLIVACSKQDEAATTANFDAKYIASEADKGNLGPLTELNTACSAEVEKNGNRQRVCAIQDEVGRLAKPLSVRF